jgi:excisionase family DNA binding protein
MLTVKQAAALAGVSASLVYGWCAEGLLVHYRFGTKGRRGKLMIDEQDLETFLASCRQEAKPQAEVPPLKHIKLQERHG